MEKTQKKKLYVGCGLTLAPQEFKDNVENLKAELRKDWDVMEFLGVTNGSASDVYQRDIVENVGGCDAFLAVADEPSWGLGWESREAAMLGKPVLLVAHAAAKVTRLLLGATEYHQNFSFKTYEDMVQDVPELARIEFAEVLARD